MTLLKVFLSFALFLALCGLSEGCDWECEGSKKCCKQNFFSYVCQDSCLGEYCADNSDCKEDNIKCCNNECRSSCVGRSCILHSDCGGDNEYCCDYSCQKGVCGLAAWLVVVIVLSVLGFVATIVGVVLCVVCAHHRQNHGLVVAHVPGRVPATTTAVVAGSNVNYAQGPPPPYYPPPQKPQA